MVTSPIRHELYGLPEMNCERIDSFINGDVVFKGKSCFAVLDTEGSSIRVNELLCEKVEGLDIYYLYTTKRSLLFSQDIYRVPNVLKVPIIYDSQSICCKAITEG